MTAQEILEENKHLGHWNTNHEANLYYEDETIKLMHQFAEQEVLDVIKWVEEECYCNGNDLYTHISTQIQYKRTELYKIYQESK
jgi:hypothetical protein